MIDINDYYTETLINGKIVHVLTFDDLKRYTRDKKKLMKAGKIRMNNETKKKINKYQYEKSWGGMPFADNNSLLKIDVNLFHN